MLAPGAIFGEDSIIDQEKTNSYSVKVLSSSATFLYVDYKDLKSKKFRKILPYLEEFIEMR